MLPCAALPYTVRSRSWQRCSPFEAGALPVLRPARRIHIRLRGRVLCNPPRLKGFRSAAAPTVTAHGTLGSWATRRMRSSLASGKSATPPARCIHRPQRDTSSAEYRLLVSRASCGASREPESCRSPALIPHTCAVSPTFRYGAFFFVVFALADLSSAHLSASTTAQQIRRGQLINRSSLCADRQQLLYHYCAQLQCPNTRG